MIDKVCYLAGYYSFSTAFDFDIWICNLAPQNLNAHADALNQKAASAHLEENIAGFNRSLGDLKRQLNEERERANRARQENENKLAELQNNLLQSQAQMNEAISTQLAPYLTRTEELSTCAEQLHNRVQKIEMVRWKFPFLIFIVSIKMTVFGWNSAGEFGSK